jgi:hypothetical protein
MSEGRWRPSWRFQPLARIEDAFRLLDKVAAAYVLTSTEAGVFVAEVRVGGHTGRALGEPKAAIITLALARAIKLYPSDGAAPSFASLGARRKGRERRR